MNEITIMPRFRGKAFEVNGLWGYELVVSVEGDNEEPDIYIFEPKFKTRQEAINHLQAEIKDIAKYLAKEMCTELPASYLDLRNDMLRRWDKSDEH